MLHSCIDLVERMRGDIASKVFATVRLNAGIHGAFDEGQYYLPPEVEHALVPTREGVYAASDLPAGATLLSIPASQLITLNTVLHPQHPNESVRF